MNTYNGLYSLYFEKVHLACAAASLEDIESLVPGVSLTAIRFCQYPVGFYVKKKIPEISGIFQILHGQTLFLQTAKKEAAEEFFLTGS